MPDVYWWFLGKEKRGKNVKSLKEKGVYKIPVWV